MLIKPKIGEIWQYGKNAGLKPFGNCYLILNVVTKYIDLCCIENLIKGEVKKFSLYPQSSFDNDEWYKIC